MNLTNILLGSTGVLLVVALFLSYGKMDKERESDPDEGAKLRREIEQLRITRNQLQQNHQSQPSLIFPNNYSSPDSNDSSPQGDSPPAGGEATNEKIDELQKQIEALTAAQETPDPEPNLEASGSEPEEVTASAEDAEAEARSDSRSRLIRDAILQATVLKWSPEEWIGAIEPTSRANFMVGDELALRRNNGILCYFTVTREAQGAFIVALRGSLADDPPEVVPGDELIIPPAFDGKLD